MIMQIASLTKERKEELERMAREKAAADMELGVLLVRVGKAADVRRISCPLALSIHGFVASKLNVLPRCVACFHQTVHPSVLWI